MTKEDIKAQVRQAFDHRVSIRVYNDKDIPREDMEYILDMAWLSPSSIGLEPWRFVVLDRKAIAKIADDLKPASWGAGSQLDTASHFALLLAEKNVRYDSQAVKDSLYRKELSEDMIASRLLRYEDFQKNHKKMADDERLLWEWAAKQTYIALGNMMTAASFIGIDSCPIEGFHDDEVNDVLVKHGLIDPDKEKLATMVSFGYRASEPKHKRVRKDRSAVVTWVD